MLGVLMKLEIYEAVVIHFKRHVFFSMHPIFQKNNEAANVLLTRLWKFMTSYYDVVQWRHICATETVTISPRGPTNLSTFIFSETINVKRTIKLNYPPTASIAGGNLVFFQNEEIFVKLDELDELDRITQAWIGSNYSLIQVQKTIYCNG